MSEREKTIEPCWGQCGITELQARLSAVLEGLQQIEGEMRESEGSSLPVLDACLDDCTERLAALRTVGEQRTQEEKR